MKSYDKLLLENKAWAAEKIQNDSEYSIHGNIVLVKLFNRSFIVLKDGQIFNS